MGLLGLWRPERRNGSERIIKVPRIGVVVAQGPVAVETNTVGEVRGLPGARIEDEVRPLALACNAVRTKHR